MGANDRQPDHGRLSDSSGAQAILDAIRKRWPWVKHLFADGAYDRRTLMDKAAFKDFVIEIIKRLGGEPGFKAPPRRSSAKVRFLALSARS